MNCPCCGKEMIVGVVHSGSHVFFTTKAHKWCFVPNKVNNDVLLSSHNLTRPTCTAYHCVDCKKVVIDFSSDFE